MMNVVSTKMELFKYYLKCEFFINIQCKIQGPARMTFAFVSIFSTAASFGDGFDR